MHCPYHTYDTGIIIIGVLQLNMFLFLAASFVLCFVLHDQYTVTPFYHYTTDAAFMMCMLYSTTPPEVVENHRWQR